MNNKQFGGKLTAAWQEYYAQSPQWQGGKFVNLELTETAINWRQLPSILFKQIKGHPQGNPKCELLWQQPNFASFHDENELPTFAWLGHSAVLMHLAGKTMLIDPMLGPDSSPVGPKRTKRFSANTLAIIDTLPPIDLVLLTHDHYDHLDYASIIKLKEKTAQFFVALGVKRHLLHWGVADELITEFDWWQQANFGDINICFTPTRHFSGRGLSSMAKCLWGGWTFTTAQHNIWFSGDGGYGTHFLEIGERLGPFDFGFMECGQYGRDWPQIHLFPDEAVQAALDARVKKAMPVHWGAFNLSYEHAWYAPVEEFVKHAGDSQLPVLTPALGSVFNLISSSLHWWKEYK